LLQRRPQPLAQSSGLESSNLTLTIACSTTLTRVLDRVCDLRNLAGDSFLLIIQVPGDEIISDAKVLEITARWKLEHYFQGQYQIIFDHSKGVAKSRNIALKVAQTDLIWFIDDDIEILQEANKAIKLHHQNSPSTVLIGWKSLNQDGTDRKHFPSTSHPLNLWNSAKFATFELTCNLNNLDTKLHFFDERFGAGMENFVGDEYTFIAKVLKSGGPALYVPQPLAAHPDQSSGLSDFSGINKSRRKMLISIHGRTKGVLFDLIIRFKRLKQPLPCLRNHKK